MEVSRCGICQCECKPNKYIIPLNSEWITDCVTHTWEDEGTANDCMPRRYLEISHDSVDLCPACEDLLHAMVRQFVRNCEIEKQRKEMFNEEI